MEVDHIEVVPHVLRFAYFLPAGPPARETCKNSRRRGVRRQQFQIVILASAHGKKSTNRVEVVSGARELDRVVGEGRPGLASSSGRRKRRSGRGGHSCGQRGATTDVSELCAPLGPSSAARADASPRIAPCARGFYRFVDGDERASVADHFFRAARPTSPQRSPASQAASWQTAGSRAAVGNVIRKVTQVCHRVVFAAMRT